MKKLFLVFLLLLGAAPAAAQNTRANMGVLNNSYFVSCGTNCITGKNVNTWNAAAISAMGFLGDTNYWAAQNTFAVNPVFSGCTGYLYGNGSGVATCSSTVPTGALSGSLSALTSTTTGSTTARTLAARGGDIGLNVLDYGADPTFNNASDSPISYAMSLCTTAWGLVPGGTVYFPPGHYKIASGINYLPGCNIKADPSAHIQTSGSVPAIIYTGVGVANSLQYVSLEGGVWDCSSNGGIAWVFHEYFDLHIRAFKIIGCAEAYQGAITINQHSTFTGTTSTSNNLITGASNTTYYGIGDKLSGTGVSTSQSVCVMSIVGTTVSMGVCNGNTPTVAVNGTASGSTTISVDGSYQNQLLIEDFIISYNSTLVANSYGIATASGSTGTANDLIDKGNIIGYDNAANMTIYSSHMSNLHAWSYSSATVGFNLTGSATWLSNMEVDGPIASYAYEFSGGGGLNGSPFYLSQSEFLQSGAAGGYAVYVNTATPVVASNNLFHSAGSASEFVQDFYGDSSYLVNNNNMSLLYSGASLAGGNLMSGYGSPNGYRYGQPGDLFVDHVNAKLYVQQNTTPANTGWVQK